MIDLYRKTLRNAVTVEVQCPTAEKLLNRCLADGIDLDDVRRPDVLTAVFTIGAKDFFRLRVLVRGLHCRVRIRRKTGLHWLLLPWRKRPVFFFGLLAAAGFLIYATGFLWKIQGADPVVLHQLQQRGITPGIRMDQIDWEMLKESIVADEPKLSWVGLNLSGTTLLVDVRYREEKPEIIPLDDPCSIYAERDGVLTGLYAYRGNPTAKVGTTVRRGDLLVSAEMPVGKDGRYVLHHALADAQAQTWYDLTASSLSTASEKRYTGEEESVTWGIFCGQKIKIVGNYGKTQGEYDIMIEEIYDAELLPLRMIRETRRYYTTELIPLSADSEEIRLRDELTNLLNSSMTHGEITAAEVMAESASDSVRVRLRCECSEDIGVARPYAPISPGR